MNKTLCVIFSWKGQFENAVRLEETLSKLTNTLVINSDDVNKKDHWINIGDACYFSDQFRTALEYFKRSDADFLFHIQADASLKSDNWDEILLAAEHSFNKYNWGVYAPNVDDTFYKPNMVDVWDLSDGLKLVANTDNTCWIIHKDIVNDMITHQDLMKNNHLGWGWDLLICSFSHLRERFVIRDYNYLIDHPKSTGYKKEQAEHEMLEMYNACDDRLKQIVYYIKIQPKQIYKFYNFVKDDTLFVYNTEG